MKRAFKRRNILNGKEMWLNFSTKSTNYCELCVPGLISTMEKAYTTSCTHNAVQSAFKRRNISNGREITLNFRRNRRIIAIYGYLGLFRRWGTGVQYVLLAERSAKGV